MKTSCFILLLSTSVAWFSASSASAQWVQTNPSGGVITALTVSGPNLFEGSLEGAYHSTNNGRSFIDISTGLTGYVAAFTVIGDNLFAGTFGSGIFRSSDNGASWTPASNGLTDSNVWAFAAIGTNLFAGTRGRGVFRSTDRGTSWTAASHGLGNDTIHALLASGPNLFAGTFNGIFLSTDSGANWKEVDNGPTGAIVLCFATIGTNLFAGTTNGIYLTTNNGTTWTRPDTGLTSPEVTSFAVLGTNIFAGTAAGGIFLSFNNGLSWIPVNTGLADREIDALAVSDTNTASPKLFAGTNSGGGVYVSTDLGGEWAAANPGPRTANDAITTMNVIRNDLFVGSWFFGLSTDEFDIFHSTDDGTSWTNADNGLSGNYEYIDAIVASDPIVSVPTLFVGTYNNGVFSSIDNGATWTPASAGLTNKYVEDLVVSGTSLFAGTWGGIFRSTDNGASWSAANNGLTSSTIVQTLAVIGANTSSPMLFAGTDDVNGEIFRSSDNGASWEPSNTGVANGNINALISIGANLFAATDSGVFVSTNNGTSWKASSNGLDRGILDFAVSGTNLFAASLDGVFLSTNDGTSWTSVSTGLPLDLTFNSQFVGHLAVKGSNLFAGTASGVWRRPLSEMINTNAVTSTLPADQSISAYPNPCISSATIALSCAESAPTEITIVNPLGARVARIYSGELDAGMHSFTWNASGTAPGTYFCIVRSGGHETRTSIVVE